MTRPRTTSACCAWSGSTRERAAPRSAAANRKGRRKRTGVSVLWDVIGPALPWKGFLGMSPPQVLPLSELMRQPHGKQHRRRKCSVRLSHTIIRVLLPLAVRDVHELPTNYGANRRLVRDREIAVEQVGARSGGPRCRARSA